MKILLRYNNIFFILLVVSFLFSACGSQSKEEAGSVTIQSSPFSEIKTIASKVKAYLEIGGKTCEFELDPDDTTLKDNQKCTDIPMGSHSYKIVYKFIDTGVILANTEGTITLISGKDNEIYLAPPEKDIDDDGDGFKNFYEILQGTDPKDPGLKPVEDKTPPAVNSTNPANSATNIPVNSKISATFSEAIDSKTMTNETFTVSNGSTNIPGTFSFNGMTVTFTPSGSLSKNTTYTVTITTGVKDLVGNPMAGNNTWSFTTYNSGTNSDTTAPSNTTGTNFINSGASASNSTSVTLFISATDSVGVTGYYASESSATPSASDAGWKSISSTTSYSAGVTFTLSNGDGAKTVYVWFKDAVGNISVSSSEIITLDIVPPDTAITSQPSNPTNSTSASFSFTSSETGTTFQCRVDNGSFSACTSPKSFTGLANGNHAFEVKATDAAGNTDSPPASYTWGIDATAPTNTTTSNFINSGATTTNSTNVPLTLSATDNTGVTGYCVKESSVTPSVDDTCWTSISSTTSYSAGITFTLSTGDGAKAVYIWFKDEAGNISSVISDSISLSLIPAAPDGVVVTGRNGRIILSWTPVEGATSYNIYWSKTPGVSKMFYAGKISNISSPYIHTGLTNDTTYYYVVSALNDYGESAESTVKSTQPVIVSDAWAVISNYSTLGGYGGAQDMAVDTSGNVYVTGFSNDGSNNNSNDYTTIKYDSNGKQLWRAKYNGTGNVNDYASSLAVDASGNSIVTGTSINANADSDIVTVKYDSSGTQLWVARYDSGNDSANKVALDSSGNIYVTGNSYDINGYAFVTVKYDSGGNQLWVSRYVSLVNSWYNRVSDLVLDFNGNAYITGNSCPIGGNICDITTIKYDSNGNELWVKSYNGPANGDDKATALTVDSGGNIYVAGWSSTSSNSSICNYIIIKYDTNGIQLWESRYNGTGQWSDIPSAIVVDSTGNVYVSGTSNGDNTGNDYATIKYDSNGNQLWVARYNSFANQDDTAVAMACDSAGNVYVTGYSIDSSSAATVTIKYDADGNQLWLRQYVGYRMTPSAIVVDIDGNVYVAGKKIDYYSTSDQSYFTVKYSQ